MRGIVRVATLVALQIVVSASASWAASPAVSCDKMKGVAAGNLFSDILRCNNKALGDLSFDLTECRTRAYNKCVTRFGIADAKFGGACFFTANGPMSCQDTLNSANTIYGGI